MLTVLLLSLMVSIWAAEDVECPVCLRVMKASIEIKKEFKHASAAYHKYCSLTTLDTSEQKFCYDVSSLSQEISRALDMGADAYRICKKVKNINPDFCKAPKVNQVEQRISTAKKKRGIIYE